MPTLQYSEQLQEALLSLERSRQQEQRLRKESDAILCGLSALLGAANRDEVLSILHATFQSLIDCENCWVMSEENGRLVSNMNDISFLIGKGFTRVLNGGVLNAFDVSQIPEWQNSEASNIHSALHLPLKLSTSKGMLILTSTSHAHFTRESIELAQRVIPFSEQAAAKIELIEMAHAKEMEEQIQQQLLHTQKLESLGVLAGGIAHDFNNILTAIMGHAAMAERKTIYDPEAVKKHLQRIVDSSETAADLCKQMLAYSGHGKFIVKPVNVSELITGIINILEVSLNKGVILKLSLMDSLPMIESDSSQIQQIVMNLITNANEAIESKNGVISIHTGVMHAKNDYLAQCLCSDGVKDGHFVFIEVADSGCGMSMSTMEKIFDPFFTTKFTGRGLGMSAVLGIVRGHHGALKLHSEPGQGTTFRILFPALEHTYYSTNDTEQITLGDKGASVVLVVDDEEAVREMATMILNDAGIDGVLTATDGREALEIYKREKDNIDLILLDLTMPNMDGEEAFQQLCLINPDVKVILSSGYSKSDIEERFAGKGLCGFLQKPYMPDALEQIVNTTLGRNQHAG